ncbi:hypothetical protein SAMN04487955_109187 [Halomonas korlensis]|uniref:Uncharacterized protein n=1 Tax=Halomonas korlensis TaxID=463301 RepID=A0A1I7J9H6_9GAMM|nr:hypothetical protein SAMN04487955_109187 [Halomonas korlensis]
MLVATRLTEGVDHRLQPGLGRGGIGPEVGAVRLLLAGGQHQHRRLVGMQHRLAEQQVAQGIDQRLEPYAADADPLGQGGARNRDTGAGEDLRLR